LGRDVGVTPARPDPALAAIVAIYATDAEAIKAVWTFDFGLANHSGAALSLVPAAVAAKFAAARSVPDTIAENLSEIANVGTSLLNAPGGLHLRFRTLILTAAELPPSVQALVRSPPRRLDVNVTISGYGAGRLMIGVAA
jgi:hypothetical protein